MRRAHKGGKVTHVANLIAFDRVKNIRRISLKYLLANVFLIFSELSSTFVTVGEFQR